MPFPCGEMRNSLQFIDTVSPVKPPFLCSLLDSSMFSLPSHQMTSCELSWSNPEPLKIQAFCQHFSIPCCLCHFVVFFLAILVHSGSLFLKDYLIRYHSWPELFEQYGIPSSGPYGGRRRSIQHKLQDISYEQYNLCSASKTIMTIGKWQHLWNFILNSMMYVKHHFKETPICKTQVTQLGFQTQSLQLFSFICCSSYKFYWSWCLHIKILFKNSGNLKNKI